MAYTQAEIDALKSAIASGALTVKFDDLTTTYRDLDEMNEILGNMEKEVNEGKNFANLRQIFNSMILAAWYKETLKESLLGQVYVDQNKVAGIDADDKSVKEKIYQQYIESFKKGVYKETPAP